MPTYKPLAQVVADLQAGLPPAPGAGFLGGDPDPAQSALALLAVPWEATVSYGTGTAAAPPAIVRASHQLDLEDRAFGRPYQAGIAWLQEDKSLVTLNRQAAKEARTAIARLEMGAEDADATAWVNEAGERLNRQVRQAVDSQLGQGRAVGLVGGDHSSPYGLIAALEARHPEGFGILHLDAHHDLRLAYEGFRWSHASIMRNVMENLPGVKSLVSVGIRDYSREEAFYAAEQAGRIHTHYAADLFREQAGGRSFADLTARILQSLPQKVYVSFDIDALDPSYCPHTGTPVPGGLSYDQAGFLLEELAAGGREVIGFDLCEVAPAANGGEWDANVGARVLYRLCGCLLRSKGLC
jgi:agmatinase